MTVDVRLELQRKLNSEPSKQLPRLCSERKTTTSRLKRSSESRGIRLWLSLELSIFSFLLFSESHESESEPVFGLTGRAGAGCELEKVVLEPQVLELSIIIG